MENNIYIKFSNHLSNISQELSLEEIASMEVSKSFFVYLMKSNLLVVHDSKTNTMNKLKYREAVTFFKIQDFTGPSSLFITIGNDIILLSLPDLKVLKAFDLGMKTRGFCFFEAYNDFNFEIIFVSERNEIMYFNQGLLVQNQKVLYKESETVDKIFYSEPYLYWNSGFVMKIFDLQNKIIPYRKSYDKYFKVKNTKDNIIDFLVFEEFLIMNVMQRVVHVIQVLNTAKAYYKDIALFEDSKSLFHCVWVNAARDKIFLLKSSQSLRLEIFNMNSSQVIFTREFQQDVINLDSYFVSFNQKTYSLYIHDSKEVYYLTLYDRVAKMLNDLRENNINVLDVFRNYSKLVSYDQKFFVVSRLVRNLKAIINKSNTSKIQTIVTEFCEEYEDRAIKSEMIVHLFIKYRCFEFCYTWINKYLNDLSLPTKEKILTHLAYWKNFPLLQSFIQSQSKLDTLDVATHEFMLSQIAKYEDDDRERLISCYALLNLKLSDYKLAIEYYLKIDKMEEVTSLLKGNEPMMILNFPILFDKFNEEKLLEILNNLVTTSDEKYTVQYIEALNANRKKCIPYYKLLIESGLSEKLLNAKAKRTVLDKLFEEECVELIIKFLWASSDLDHEDILDSQFALNYKPINSNLSSMHSKYDDVKIVLFYKLGKYKEVLRLNIDTQRDPEKAITFIENLDCSSKDRELYYQYLKRLIEENKEISPIKKFYFINLFKEMVSETLHRNSTTWTSWIR